MPDNNQQASENASSDGQPAASQQAVITTPSGARVSSTASFRALNDQQLQNAIAADTRRRMAMGPLTTAASSSNPGDYPSQGDGSTLYMGQASQGGSMMPPPPLPFQGQSGVQNQLSPGHTWQYRQGQWTQGSGRSFVPQNQQLQPQRFGEQDLLDLLYNDDSGREDEAYMELYRARGSDPSDKGKRPALEAPSLAQHPPKQLRITETGTAEYEGESAEVPEIDPATGEPVSEGPTSTRPAFRNLTFSVTVEADWGTSLGPNSEGRTKYRYDISSKSKSRGMLQAVLRNLGNIQLHDQDALAKELHEMESWQRK
ncbi:hypothetical protein L202_07154 [Cryptococcus amylolentus CBS 6039]|uniref:Uncharacterized protein n=1 Tax=Cryptococcus amylolentus CBS 6039 TaxID=1295533 RepID=A0A1E3HER9_9TREE|nr:hypothetical protein L202_07154 [Cryptococcus amylolentus CBS 6039]ODN74849.1 hypothetical protein L202_07154 [Cryptococcus amylolentus CBS 6039]